jgi:quercetin dioxygenase-like cupin family protein
MTKGKVTHYTNIEAEDLNYVGSKGVKRRWLIDDKNDGAPVYALRMFEVEPCGYSPRHSHDWEHENYIIEGEGRLWLNDQWNDIKSGDVAYIAPNLEHQFENTGDTTLRFLCGIPVESRYR